MTDPQPTTKAVVAYARQLRTKAAAKTNPDSRSYEPYARPYAPTDASARKLAQRHGPEGALRRLRELALEADLADRDRDRASRTALETHAARQANTDAKRNRARERLTPGQRIDQALRTLNTVAAAPTARIDAEPVHGGERNHAPRHNSDPAAKAHTIAITAARAIEDELDRARRRDLPAALRAA